MTITITDDAVTPTITKKKELRIRIPSGFPMSWDTSVITVTIGGPAAGKMKTKLKAYEDGGKTAVLDVNGDFAAGDQIIVDGLAFQGFAAPAAADNLEIDVDDDQVGDATDDKTIDIVAGGSVNISSAANQEFNIGDPPTAIAVITVADASTASITAANDLRIRLPSASSVVWDSSDTTVTLGGSAAASVSTTVTYEDSDQTLVLDVTTNFGAGDYITIADLSFTNFVRAGTDRLELEIANDDVVSDTDDKTLLIRGPLMASAVDQLFTVADPPTTAALITITDDPIARTIQAKRDIRIRIPAGFNMVFDTSVTTVTLGGTGSGLVDTNLLAYEGGGTIAVLDVTKNFNPSDTLTIDGLFFTTDLPSPKVT